MTTVVFADRDGSALGPLGERIVPALLPLQGVPMLERALEALVRAGTRFFLSTGPPHSHWFRPSETVAFAHEVRKLGLVSKLRLYASRKGEWRAQFDDGLRWAFGR